MDATVTLCHLLRDSNITRRNGEDWLVNMLTTSFISETQYVEVFELVILVNLLCLALKIPTYSIFNQELKGSGTWSHNKILDKPKF